MTPIVPVLLIFFRRRCVLEVLCRIRAYAPDQLFLVADGGRNPVEHAQCLEVRRLVEAAIDWPCQVERLYSDTNLGCRGNIPRGISWVFSHVDRAIILEDDTVPNADFFAFCSEMLQYYADDHRVMTISGANFCTVHSESSDFSYVFSGYSETTGYATWARAWHLYDPEMRLWPVAKGIGLLESSFLAPLERIYWHKIFEEVWDRTCTCDPYDYQWLFASWVNNGLSIVPRSNLITNIGSGAEATHTHDVACRLLDRPVQGLDWPLKHPPVVVRSAVFDVNYGRFMFYGEPKTFWHRLRTRIVIALPNPIRSCLRAVRSMVNGQWSRISKN